jgi:Domain of unknown function (DUF4383)
MGEQDMARNAPGPARFTWQQKASLVMGVVYLLFGVLGFFFSGSSTEFAGHNTEATMFGLELNGVQDLVHVVLGIIGLGCTAQDRSARAYGGVLAVVGAALFVLGVIAVGHDAINFLSLNWPDNIVHGLTALVGLAMVFHRADKRAAETSPAGRNGRG